ncbi:rap guanine nucleotide exchange factor 1 isoform X1 [Lates japonicus]|uniref:Rap guanine nucleotide exchange factor 1 isoform X1 n=1 Tax=Lates japonicus TaxID=270547 RepID=A0AAD3MBQ7_LATJO|nr:rap guanine nucleotide exchange factor 1 isoform X1 [Lates japonicus]
MVEKKVLEMLPGSALECSSHFCLPGRWARDTTQLVACITMCQSLANPSSAGDQVMLDSIDLEDRNMASV